MYVNVIKDVMAYYRSSYDKLTLDITQTIYLAQDTLLCDTFMILGYGRKRLSPLEQNKSLHNEIFLMKIIKHNHVFTGNLGVRIVLLAIISIKRYYESTSRESA